MNDRRQVPFGRGTPLGIRSWLFPVASLLVLVPGVQAQQVQTMLSLTGEGGYLTNTYLAPAFPVWEQTARAPFLSVRPRVGLSWSKARQRLSLWGSAQYTYFPDTRARWWVGQGQGRYSYAISNRWTGGLNAAATRSETSFGQWLFWGAPFLRWQVTPLVHLEVQGGGTMQLYDAETAQPNTSSPFVSAEVGLQRGHWSATGSLYFSRTVETETEGLGATLRAARQLNSSVQVSLRAGMDRYAFSRTAGGAGSVRSDQLLRTDLTTDWSPRNRWTLSARLGFQYYQTEAALADPGDVYAALGFTYRWNRTAAPSEAPAPLWEQEGDEVRVRIPYEGTGQLYLVGDFNDWRRRTLPLREASKNVYTTRLALEEGTYQYRVQVVEEGKSRWLSLPEHALTVEDGFGEKNGLIIAE